MVVSVLCLSLAIASLVKEGQMDDSMKATSRGIFSLRGGQIPKRPRDLATSFLRTFKIPNRPSFKKSDMDSYYSPDSSYPSAYSTYYPHPYPYPSPSSYPFSLPVGNPTEHPGGQSGQHHCLSTGTPAMNRTEKFQINGKSFKSIGCWSDTSVRAIETLEGKHALLKDPDYKSRVNALMKCAEAALATNLTMFALQNGGQCFGGKNAEKTFRKYGPSTACCGDGEGGPWSNEVYSFLGDNGKPIVNASYNPWSSWSPCPQTCNNGNGSAVQMRNRTCFTSQVTYVIPGMGCGTLGSTTIETRPCGVQICPGLNQTGNTTTTPSPTSGSGTSPNPTPGLGTSPNPTSGLGTTPNPNSAQGAAQLPSGQRIPTYFTIGCYRDTSNRAIQTLEGKDPILDGSYSSRINAIAKCAVAAMSRGYSMFAVQNGGWCAASATAPQTYDKYGRSTACKPDGEGGPGANQVYRIGGRTLNPNSAQGAAQLPSGQRTPTYFTIGCYRDTSNRAIQTLEGKDPILDGSYSSRINAIAKCAVAATSRGYSMFAVQNGGWCAASATAPQTYDKYGRSTACKPDGEGGPWANEVYRIGAIQQAPDIQSGTSSDKKVSASSELDGNPVAIQDSPGFHGSSGKAISWSAGVNDGNQWLQVDLGDPYTRVTGVTTQGRNGYSQWVTKYKLQYSDDGVNFKSYSDSGQTAAKEFDGNTDRDTPVYHKLAQPILRRYIRIRPTGWHGHISIRVQLHGSRGAGQRITRCRTPLGMQSGAISNRQIRASSEWDGNHAAIQGRLGFQAAPGKAGSWSARVNDGNQWLQIDLGNRYTGVTGVTTQGRNGHNQWVTKYRLQYSNDGLNFKYYKDPGQIAAKEFAGNTNRDTPVYHQLAQPIRARYIRFRPTGWYGHISMRVELHGCNAQQAPRLSRYPWGVSRFQPTSGCQRALGMQSGAIANRQIRASSEWDANHAAIQGRLGFRAAPGKAGSWSARVNDGNQWLQIDLGNRYTRVAGVTTQGRNGYSQWVTKYRLQYSDNGVNFKYYRDPRQVAAKEFVGNTDQDTPVYHRLAQPIRARYIRFRPTAWYGHISMRVELHGCRVRQGFGVGRYSWRWSRFQPASVCTAKVDLGFLIDGSGSIEQFGKGNFRRELDFVKKIISGFQVSRYGTHVGIIIFSSTARIVSGLDQHHSKGSTFAAIDGIRYPAGGTNIGRALDLARTELYGRSARPGIPNMLIVVTDGKSFDRISEPAQRLRDFGVTIFAVGIGRAYDIAQLRDMATDPDSQHVYKVDFNNMNSIVQSIKDRACMGSGGALRAPPRAPFFRYGTVCRAKVDLAILIDGSQSIEYFGKGNFRRCLRFVKRLISGFNIAKDGTHVGIVVYSAKANVIFGFERYFRIRQMYRAINRIRYPRSSTHTGEALDVVRTRLFESSARQGVPNILLVMTDGASQDDVDGPSKRLRDMGVTIFSLGVGRAFDINQLNIMATDPDRDHVFTADFSKLGRKIIERIKSKACRGSGGKLQTLGGIKDNADGFWEPSGDDSVDSDTYPKEIDGEEETNEQWGSDQDEHTEFDNAFDGEYYGVDQNDNGTLDSTGLGENQNQGNFGTEMEVYQTPGGEDNVTGESSVEWGQAEVATSRGNGSNVDADDGNENFVPPEDTHVDNDRNNGEDIGEEGMEEGTVSVQNTTLENAFEGNPEIQKEDQNANETTDSERGIGKQNQTVLGADMDVYQTPGGEEAVMGEGSDQVSFAPRESQQLLPLIEEHGTSKAAPEDSPSHTEKSLFEDAGVDKQAELRSIKGNTHPEPVALYPLSVKYQARDVIGGNLPGIIKNVVPAAGPFNQSGNSLSFNGTPDSYIEFPNNGKLDTKNSMSLLAWVLPQAAGPIFNYKTDGWGVNFWMARPRKLYARFVDRTQRALLPEIKSTHIKPNKWNFVGAVYDQNSGRASLWINGKQEDEQYIGNITLATNYPVRMGARLGEKRNFRGRISCMQIYNVALNRRQIKDAKLKCKSLSSALV